MIHSLEDGLGPKCEVLLNSSLLVLRVGTIQFDVVLSRLPFDALRYNQPLRPRSTLQ